MTSEAFEYSGNILTRSRRHGTATPQMEVEEEERRRQGGGPVGVYGLISLKLASLKRATATEMKLDQTKVSSA